MAHREVIQGNLSFFCENTNISNRLLDMCKEVGILTRDESVDIEQYFEYDRNRKFYGIFTRKDIEAFGKLVAIMESKDTLQSSEVLTMLKSCQRFMTSLEPNPKRPRISETAHSCHIRRDSRNEVDATFLTQQKVLRSKWWPEERNFNLINSFHERKIKEKLFVEELHNMLTHNETGMAVISQKVAVSGHGGVGKTTTAKWYANHYKDFYDHIIWLDCGEGSLLKSFRDLARELEIKDRNELDLKTLARESFSVLEKLKCLWVFDNAECYTGNEGIRDVLPRNESFHSIITSRNREWGNITGHGTIPQFQLDVFDIEESISFMKHNLREISFHDDDLKQLCELLGNLPLALQIATASLNRQNIKLTDYLNRVKNTDHIISKNFDDYEKTINATLKISLEFIKNNENDLKQLAYQILLTFGYIQPDNVKISFFESVEKSTIWEIQEAMDLLEKYSLISKRQAWGGDGNKFVYNMHRLLQQVTRHNGRDRRRDTIRKILICEGFLKYKLAPFIFADDELKSEFPKIRAQLIDQIELTELIKEREFTDALHLSEIIKNTMRNPASDFNYAICLKNRREFKAALEIFYEIYNSPNPGIPRNLKQYEYDATNMELHDLNYEPSEYSVGSQLFIIHLLEGRFEMADKILRREQKTFVGNSEESFCCILEALRTNNIIPAPTMYILIVDGKTIQLCLENRVQRHIELRDCQVDITRDFPQNIERLSLSRINLKADNPNEKFKIIDLSDFISSSVIHLDIDFEPLRPTDRITCNALVGLDKLTTIDKIRLSHCRIKLNDKQIKMSPRKLKFNNLRFVQCGTGLLGEIFLNELINFDQVKKIEIIANSSNVAGYENILGDEVEGLAPVTTFQESARMVLEMTGSCNVDMVVLKGDLIEIRNWEFADWNLSLLSLSRVPFEKNQMKLNMLEIERSSIKLSSIPSTVETLIMGPGTQVIHENEGFLLKQLKCLHLTKVDDNLIDIPFLLGKCENLIGLELEAMYNYKIDMSFISLCKSIKTLKMRGIDVVGAGVRTIDKLILDGYDLKEIDQILRRFRPDQLVIDMVFSDRFNGKSLFTLIPKGIKRVIVGCIPWNFFEISPLANCVDRDEKYYIFENQRGRVITEDEFQDIAHLPVE